MFDDGDRSSTAICDRVIFTHNLNYSSRAMDTFWRYWNLKKRHCKQQAQSRADQNAPSQIPNAC